MRDYLEELLGELAEEGDILSFPQAARWAASSLARGSQEDAGAEERRPDEGIGPYMSGPRSAEDGGARRVREAAPYGETEVRNPSVSFADSPLSKGAKGKSAEALRSRLRRGTIAAGYRANTPAPLEVPEKSYVREHSLLELDAAVRRDARRYDGEMTLY